jgi:putative transposase
LQVREEVPTPTPALNEPIGIDLGIKFLATCSDGQQFPNPKALATKNKQFVRWQRRLSRRQPGSCNRRKARHQIAKIHAQVADLRRDTLHKTTTAIINKQPSRIVLEDLNVQGMMQNRTLARVIADVGLYEFRRQMTYKAELAGVELLIADRFFPSSKRCSRCGRIKTDLTLAERIYRCDSCGLVIDRDLNAALNLKQLEYR